MGIVMSLEKEIIKILMEEDKEKLKRYIMAVLKPEKIDIISEEDFEKYFVITDSISTLAKILTAMCKLKERAVNVITGPRGVGKTTTLRYIFFLLKKHTKVALFSSIGQLLNARGDECIFIIDPLESLRQIIGTIKMVEKFASVYIELPPYLVLRGFEQGVFEDSWQIMILLPPRESIIREIVKRRFGEASQVVRNPLLSLLLQIRSREELGINLEDAVKKLRGTKQRILWTLTARENGMCVKEISEMVGRSPATISRHLKELEEDRLLRGERTGKKMFYRISTIGVRVAAEETIVEEILRKWGSRVFVI